MENIWKAAFAVAGVGAIAFFVFYSLYKQWLTLAVFAKLSQTQTFAVMVIFLVLTFGSLAAGLVAWNRVHDGPAVAAAPAIEASREFMIGRWEVQQKIGELEGGTYMDYLENGRVEGVEDEFVQGRGERHKVHGTWEATRIAKDKFSLTINLEGADAWQGNFRIIDRDHIHNTTENYEAVRVLR
jgi:hypothetical protein